MNLYFRLLALRLRNRRRRALSVWETSRTPMRVAPTDLDLLRHVNNGKYLTMLDVGRMDLLTRSGLWAQVVQRGWYPVVAGQSITYRRSLTLGQAFDLYTRILGYQDRWVYVEQTFVRGNDVYARAIVRSRFLKKSGGSVDNDELRALTGEVPDDREIASWIGEWESAARIPEPPFVAPNNDE